MNKDTIFIPGHVPSSKNSRVWTGRFFVQSKACQTYKKQSEHFWSQNKQVFLGIIKDKSKPYRIELFFYRKTRHKFDYINAAQIVCDQMTSFGWIEDDNADEIIPVFIPYEYNKEHPGVRITIL